MVLLEQGKLAEAEPLLVEAVAWFQKTTRISFPRVPVELRREQGRLAEAEQELGTLVADLGEMGSHSTSSPTREAVAARLRHAQPGGAAAALESCAPWWSGCASSWARRTAHGCGSGCSDGRVLSVFEGGARAFGGACVRWRLSLRAARVNSKVPSLCAC